MEEQLISFETAKLAKDGGFELNSCSYYELLSEGQFRYKFISEEDDNGTWVNEDPKNRIACCTQSLLQKWLREEFGIHIIIEPVFKNESQINYYGYRVKNSWDPSKIGGIGDTYEEALEVGLVEALKLIDKAYEQGALDASM